MMKSILVYISLTFAFSSSTASACTIMEMLDGTVIHNVDWFDQLHPDGMIVMNPAHLSKTGLLYGANVKAATWKSKYKSMTFSIAGAEFPVAGFNEKGLFMGILMLNDAKYPDVEDSRDALAVTQFVQYNLDLSAKIEDVIRSGDKVRPYSKTLKMHYFACDASKKCAVFQYVNGELHIYSNIHIKTKSSQVSPLDFRALTNSLYPESVKAANDCLSKNQCKSEEDLSLARFSEVIFLGEQMSQPTFHTSYEILNHVAQSKGLITRFQLIYDPAAQQMQVRRGGQTENAYVTADFQRVRCDGQRRVIPIDSDVRGDLSRAWTHLSPEMQYDIIIKSGQPAAAAQIAGRYPFDSTTCKGDLN